MATIQVNDYPIDNVRGVFYLVIKKIDRSIIPGKKVILLAPEMFDEISSRPMDYSVSGVNTKDVKFGIDTDMEINGLTGYVYDYSVTFEIIDGIGYVHYDG